MKTQLAAAAAATLRLVANSKATKKLTGRDLVDQQLSLL